MEKARHHGPYQPRVRLAQAKALNVAGMLADDQSDYAAARALFQESLAICRELGDPPGAAMALNNLGGQAQHARDYPAARALYEESLALSRAIGDQWSAAAALTNLGRVALVAGEYASIPAPYGGRLPPSLTASVLSNVRSDAHGASSSDAGRARCDRSWPSTFSRDRRTTIAVAVMMAHRPMVSATRGVWPSPAPNRMPAA